MCRIELVATALAIGLGLGGCSLKYDLLSGTSVPNPPSGPIKIYIKEFKVESKASVVDPSAAVGGASVESGSSGINALASSAGNKLIEISRPTRIEDLSGAIARELRRDKVRVFSQLEVIKDLQTVRVVANPFQLVSSDAEAQLEISGSALISSQRIGKVFSQETKSIEVAVTVKDLKNGAANKKTPLRAGVKMVFNSKELEEAMAIAVVTNMAQKILF
ncbi:MAG: hypothetical protein HYW07_01840 [Candidatus Latescibacteria bacterium]|nr:hypothetical protein [Candidatus Latescibacterota bacterium]